jgi:Fur family ferric uptake transcriptional regulator
MKAKTAEIKLNEIIKASGLKITTSRLEILDLLSQKHCLLTIDEIAKKLKTKTDWATVYRTIIAFEKKGIISSSTMSDGSIRYEFADQNHSHHHHHVMCKSCNTIQPIDHCDIEDLLKRVKKMGFTNISHQLEFSGTCKNCSNHG